jgi:hypothetical protein
MDGDEGLLLRPIEDEGRDCAGVPAGTGVGPIGSEVALTVGFFVPPRRGGEGLWPLHARV